MDTIIGKKACIPNPALTPFAFLIGEWQTTGSHPYLPDTLLHGHTSFEWLAGGAFVIIQSEIDHPKFPHGVAILGSDDSAEKFFILYFDERGTSRKFDVTITESEMWWRRDNPSFSQQSHFRFEENGNKIVSTGTMARDGGKWEEDLSLTYRKVS